MLLGVMGNPIEHSLSPKIHEAFAKEAEVSLEYRKILVRDGDFQSTVVSFIGEGAKGFNITLPHKGDAFDIVNECSVKAQLSQAVNTVVIENDGRMIGHNTDGDGLLKDIEKNLSWSLKGKSVLILGAGGAVRGVLPALLSAEPQKIDIYNRTQKKAEGILEKMPNNLLKVVGTPNEVYDFIISGSSVGLSVNDFNMPSEIIGPQTKTYDMIYSHKTTPFQAWSKAQNCKEAADGLGMLVEQAAIAFTLWTSRSVSTQNVIQKIRTSV